MACAIGSVIVFNRKSYIVVFLFLSEVSGLFEGLLEGRDYPSPCDLPEDDGIKAYGCEFRMTLKITCGYLSYSLNPLR